jgi:hypothetical protein
MELTMRTLSSMLSEAFDTGYGCIGEERDLVVAEILAKYNMREEDDKPPAPPKPKTEEMRLWKTAELKQFAAGTLFMHSSLGKCRISQRQGEKYVSFDNPAIAPAALNVDGYPWDQPMKLIS